MRSGAIDELVHADDQFEAYSTLSDRAAEDFGLIVTAEPGEDENAAISVRTSALMFAWGRDEDAERLIEVAVAHDLGDTTESDRAFGDEHRG